MMISCTKWQGGRNAKQTNNSDEPRRVRAEQTHEQDAYLQKKN